MKTTNKAIKERYPVITIGYCDLQNLLSYRDRDFHTEGTYGWNSDVYIVYYNNGTRKAAISTGYRPIGGNKPAGELIRSYEQKAMDIKDIEHGALIRWKEKKELLDNLLIEFVEKAMEV